MSWGNFLFGENKEIEPIPIDELDYRFQNMEELKDVVRPNVTTQPVGTVQPNVATQPDGVTQPAGTVQPNVATQPNKGFNRVFTPRTLEVDTKLTVFFVENTKEVAKEKATLEKMASLVTTGYVCVINYGRVVRKSKTVEVKDFKGSELLCQEYIGDNACLYDAINALEGVVEEYYKKTEDVKYKKIRFKEIEIIGIGRCFDNCSMTSSQTAIESFSRVAKRLDVTTKYFCLSEESFIQTATIGFHSIGSIAKNYM